MRVVIRVGPVDRVVEVVNATGATTLDQVLRGAGVEQWVPGRVWVDGREHPLGVACASAPLLDGSVVSDSPAPPLPHGHVLAEIAGPGTGALHPLTSAASRVGRSPGAGIHVANGAASWSHAVLTRSGDRVWLRDDHSSNGTAVDGELLDPGAGAVELHDGQVVQIGDARLMLTRAPDWETAAPGGTRPPLNGRIAFNRPPRPGPPPAPAPVEVPVKKEPQRDSKFSWAAVLAPLVMAVGLVAVMGSFRYALLALLSPVMGVASWWEQKRRARSSEKEVEAQFARDLERFGEEISAAAVLERERLRAITAYPHEGIAVARAGAAPLWRARAGHEDFWRAQAGTGRAPYAVPLDTANRRTDPRAQRLIDAAHLVSAPVPIDLAGGGVGVWGPREHALALARSLLCQSATRSGPSDMGVAVLTGRSTADDWRWAAWLPHTLISPVNPHSRWMGFSAEASAALARQLRDSPDSLQAPALLLVVDDASLLEGRDSPVRELLTARADADGASAPRVSAIVVADSPTRIPASCTTVIEAAGEGEAVVGVPGDNTVLEGVCPCGITAATANDWARGLARFDDPDTREAGGSLPSLVHLFELLGLDHDVTAEDIERMWRADHPYRTPIGVGEDGILWFDLVRDGPHGLVGGTTGSGKSEYLRSLIAGLAAHVDPQRLTFILVDFKGGAAFASLDQLPHTIGTLSNLEAPLAYRALRALEAEMEYRQRRFAQAGENVDTLDAYLATGPDEPMPRILVVVDEFAQLAKEYPDILSSLVSIGAVGRTLGIHMVLATQRPTGVVNDNILANTNMRTALRVQSRDDSIGVISVPHASQIGRTQPGRAYMRLGEGDIAPIQTALVTGVSSHDGDDRLRVVDAVLGEAPPEPTRASSRREPTDLDMLIRAIAAAHDARGGRDPRPVWPEPLRMEVRLLLGQQGAPRGPSVMAAPGPVVLCALADDPGRQRQYPTGWEPQEGNLVVAGIPGSGTTTALCSAALSLAASQDPDRVDFLFLDMGTRGLEPLARLPHARGYAGPGAAGRELQNRLLRHLVGQMDARASDPGPHRDLYVFIDGFASLRDEFDDYEGNEMLQDFYQVWAKGPSLGIHCAAATSRFKALPTAISEVTTQKWLFQLADLYDYTGVGVARDAIPQPVPGRFVDGRSLHHAHIATPDDLEEAVGAIGARWGAPRRPDLIGPLPKRLAPSQVGAASVVAQEPWSIPVGVAESTLAPYALEAWSGEHLLVAGPSRSGKTSVLAAIARKLDGDARASGTPLDVVGIAPRRSPLRLLVDAPVHAPGEAAAALSAVLASPRPALVLIDDAHQVGDEGGMLTALLSQPDPRALVVAAGRNDELRTQYGQWTALLRKSRLGLLLQPNVDVDGELLGVRLPRRSPVALTVARGYACQSGMAALVQAMTLSQEE